LSSNYKTPAIVFQTVIHQRSFQCSFSGFSSKLKHIGPRPSYTCDTDRGRRLSSFHTRDSGSPLVSTKQKTTLATCSILLRKLFSKTSFHNSLNATFVEAYRTDVTCFRAILGQTASVGTLSHSCVLNPRTALHASPSSSAADNYRWLEPCERVTVQ